MNTVHIAKKIVMVKPSTMEHTKNPNFVKQTGADGKGQTLLINLNFIQRGKEEQDSIPKAFNDLAKYSSKIPIAELEAIIQYN